jgi:hypothetical protein
MKTSLAVCAAAQTSTTATKSKATTTTTNNKWQSPGGMRGGSHSTTSTNTKSNSVTVGTQRPGPHNPGWSNSQRPAGQSPYAGGWSLAIGKSRPCILTLYQGFSPQGGGATTTGCASPDLQAIGNWVLQGGHTLT